MTPIRPPVGEAGAVVVAQKAMNMVVLAVIDERPAQREPSPTPVADVKRTTLKYTPKRTPGPLNFIMPFPENEISFLLSNPSEGEI
jgi:hypothetical protein